MSNGGSVAPKERVNIVYKTSLGGVQEEIELPLKLLVLGDFTKKPDERTVEEREPIQIDKDNFSEVMEGMELGLDITVPNRLTDEEGEELNVSLKISDLNDFSPESISEQVEELKKIIELREALLALKGPLGNVPAFRKRIQDIMADEKARAKLMAELSLS